MELSAEQIYLVGLIASVLGAVIRFLVTKAGGKELSKFWMTIIVAGVAVIIALLMRPPVLPLFIDPLQYVGEWLSLVGAYVGAATVIYNIVLDKLLKQGSKMFLNS